MKNTLSKKLTGHITVLALVILAVIAFGAYYAVSDIIGSEYDNFTKAITGVYADLPFYLAEERGGSVPDTARDMKAFGDYVCTWSRIDYACACIPDTENGTVYVLSLSVADGRFENIDPDSYTGSSIPYDFTDEERALIDGEGDYLTRDSDFLEGSRQVLTVGSDRAGNKILFFTGFSLGTLRRTVFLRFFTITLIVFVLFVAMLLAIHFILRVNVSRPAQRITESMTAFIREGKRTDIKLAEADGEFGMIARAFNKMSGDIDEYVENLKTLNLDKERQRTELDIASKIQKGFLPPESMTDKRCFIRASMTPALDIGGDFYDYLKLDEDRILLTIADVSGKGIAASMYMSVILMLIRQYAKTGKTPGEILSAVNDAVSERNPRLLFATAFVAIYNEKTRTLSYANAGHNPPYIVSDAVRPLDGARNTLLGLYEGETYTEADVTLAEGDSLFLYTDGVTEAVGEGGTFFGTERLEALLDTARGTPFCDYVQTVCGEVRRFTGEGALHDDVTVMTMTVGYSDKLTLSPDVEENAEIRRLILDAPLAHSEKMALCVAAEELFVNICSYAFEETDKAGQTVGFFIECRKNDVLMRFTDGGKPYDPRTDVTTAEEYDPDEQIGGLGKCIVFAVADDVLYEYKNGKNTVTVIKHREEDSYDDSENS